MFETKSKTAEQIISKNIPENILWETESHGDIK